MHHLLYIFLQTLKIHYSKLKFEDCKLDRHNEELNTYIFTLTCRFKVFDFLIGRKHIIHFMNLNVGNIFCKSFMS